MRPLELRPQLIDRHFAASPQLTVIPSIGIEVSGHAALAGGHPTQRANKPRLRRRQMDEEVAYRPTLIRARPQPIVWPDPVEHLEQVVLRIDKVLADSGIAILGHPGS